MALRKKGKYHYGDGFEDLFKELERYSKLAGYPVDKIEPVLCQNCEGDTFELYSDEDACAAMLQCAKCQQKQYILDSEENLEGELENYACLCSNEQFEVAVGISFYQDTLDVRWVYVGGYCSKCGLVGNYIDWNER